MAEIKMDVTEYESLKKNISLLEDAKKEQAELHKTIDKLKEENLQALRDVQHKVLKQVTTTSTQQIVPTEQYAEFNIFVKHVVSFMHQSAKGSIRNPDYKCEYCHSYNPGNIRDCRRCGAPNHGYNSFMYYDGNPNSAAEWFSNNLRRFIGNPIVITSKEESVPVYVGFDEVKQELKEGIVEAFNKKTKELLALEPQFHSFQKDKADMEKVITSLQKEKIELSNAVKAFNTEHDKAIELRKIKDNFISEVNYLTVNDSSIFGFSLRSKIDKLGTKYLTQLKNHEDTWK